MRREVISKSNMFDRTTVINSEGRAVLKGVSRD